MVYPDMYCWGYNNSIDDDKAFTKDGIVPKIVMKMIAKVTSSPRN